MAEPPAPRGLGGHAGKVFPSIPSRPTFQQTREAAGIVYQTHEGAATPHALRKVFGTRVDAAGGSVGVTATLMRHRSGVTQERYIRPQMADLVAVLAWLSTVCPQSVPVAQFNLTGGDARYSVSQPRSESPMPTATQNSIENGRPGGANRDVAVCGGQSGRSLSMLSNTEPASDLSCGIRHDNAEGRDEFRVANPAGSQSGRVTVTLSAAEVERVIAALVRGARDGNAD